MIVGKPISIKWSIAMRVSLVRLNLYLFCSALAVGGLAIRAQVPAAPTATPPDTIAVTATAGDEVKPRRIGGGVSAPVLTHQVEPKFSEEARARKIGGTVLVNLWVDEQGNPTHVHVIRGVGMGLDASAVEAVKQYRFKPAMEGGKPVTVELNVQVNFQIFDKKPSAAQDGVQGGAVPGIGTAGGQAGGGTSSGSGPSAQDYGGMKTVADRQRWMDDPKFAKAIAETKGSMTTDERMARWKHALKVSDNQCVACLHAIIPMQIRASQWKDAIASARQLDAIGPDPKDKFYGESELGVALLHTNNEHPKPEQLQEALTALQSAMALAAGNRALAATAKTTLLSEGRTLALLGRNAEASETFQKYVDLVGYSDSYRTRAEHFVENPHLAAMPMAPPFTLTTSEGEQISLDDMGGKVVLLDFWATWCGPCKETLPVIQKMAKNFAGQPLVVVSISGDSDERLWRTFLDKNNMTWPQFRDANGALRSAYGVTAIPQFFTIDADGVLQSVKIGSNADLEGDIRRLVKRATDAEKKKAKESERAPAGE
jgi:TonB family protein